MKIKRAPFLGLIGYILLIILLITSSTFAMRLSKKCSQLTAINNTLNITINEQMDAIEKLKEKTSDLEQQLKQKVVSTPRQNGNATSRSQEVRGYNTSLDDRETLARLVYLEANTESLECQKAIVSVVINRVNSGYWGSTVNSVVYAKNQFTPASKIPYTTPTSTNYEAVDYVLTNGVTLPTYVLYFRSSYHFSWSGYVPYTSMGNTYFGYMSKDVK